MIQIENLTKTYRTGFFMHQKPALKGISLSVPRGMIYGFIGPNGAGKSTTIKILTGLLGADSGKVAIAGMPPKRPQTRKILGYCPEQPYFYDYLSGRELLSFYGRLVGLEGATLNARIQWALQTVHADKDWIDRRLTTYSKGMMQRVGLAQSILSKPELLILDEPMSGLDPMGRRDVREAILSLNQEGVTIFYSSHLLSDVESISERVAMIVDGKIVREGTVEEITESASTEYHVRTGQTLLEQDLPQNVVSTGHPQEWVCKDATSKDAFLSYCLSHNISIEKMENSRPSLEEVLTKEIARAES